MLNLIAKVNAVSLHVRRTDYITDIGHNTKVGVCDLDYYKYAIQHIKEQIDKPYFLITKGDITIWTC